MSAEKRQADKRAALDTVKVKYFIFEFILLFIFLCSWLK